MTTTLTVLPTASGNGVLCGNRKAHGTDRVHHESVAAVRACFSRNTQRVVAADPDAFAVLLVEDEAPVPSTQPTIPGLIAQGRKSGLSAHLDDPRSVVSAKAALIPVSDTDDHAGYGTLAADGKTVQLWEVERPSTGKFAGVTFVRPIGRSYKENLKGAERARVILAIAADVEVAADLYFDNTQKCSTCRHKIWAKESLARKRGPVCDGRVRAAKAALEAV